MRRARLLSSKGVSRIYSLLFIFYAHSKCFLSIVGERYASVRVVTKFADHLISDEYHNLLPTQFIAFGTMLETHKI